MNDSRDDRARSNAAVKAVEGWLDDYLFHVFGIRPQDAGSVDMACCPPRSASTESATAETATERIAPYDFIEQVRSRFAHLDLAPRDGVISIFEIEHAIANPRLNFDERDLRMLQLLKRFYSALAELSDDEHDRMDKGISRSDIEILDRCLGESCAKLKARLQKDFRQQ